MIELVGSGSLSGGAASLAAYSRIRSLRPDRLPVEADLQFWFDASQLSAPEDPAVANAGIRSIVEASHRSSLMTAQLGGTGSTRPLFVRYGGPNNQPAIRIARAGFNSTYFTLPDFLTSFTAGHIFNIVRIDTDPPGANSNASPPTSFGQTTDDYYTFSDSKIYDGFASTARKTTVNPTPTLAAWRLYEVRSASAAWSNWLDGTQLFTTGTNTVGWTTAPRVASTVTNSKTLCGLIAEIIFFSRVLNSTEIAALKNYFARKYGLTLA
jgi:hypothetical protein